MGNKCGGSCTELYCDQDLKEQVHLLLREEQYKQIKGRRQVVCNDRDGASSEGVRESVGGSVLARQDVPVVREEVQVLEFRVRDGRRVVPEGHEPARTERQPEERCGHRGRQKGITEVPDAAPAALSPTFRPTKSVQVSSSPHCPQRPGSYNHRN